MTPRLLRIASLLALIGVVGYTRVATPGPSRPSLPAADSLVAFVNARVVSMRVPTAASGQTVVVRRGVIAAVGPSASVAIPPGARVIDVRDRFLMPGLTDFHVHIGEQSDLLAYVAAGVTTTVNMGGANAQALRAWRDSVRAGTLVGPDIFIGAFLNGPLGLGGVTTVRTTEDVAAFVRNAAAARADFVKVYNSLTAEQFEAAVEVAGRHGLPLIGHAVRRVGLRRSLAMGQRVIVHAEEFIYDVLQSQDDRMIPDAVRFTKASGAAVVPNLSAYDVIGRQWGRPSFVDSILATPEGRRLSVERVSGWRSADYVRRPGGLVALPFLQRLTRAMQQAGVPLLLGTDSPGIPGMYAGTSIHEDLRLLVSAGLTPYEALAAGTRTAGEVARDLFKSDRFGVIEPGYRADLVMLAANPLDDVANARRPLGVLTRGRWLSGADLAPPR